MAGFRYPIDAVSLVDALHEAMQAHAHDDHLGVLDMRLQEYLEQQAERDRAVEDTLGRLPLDIPWGATGTIAAAGKTSPWTPQYSLLVVGFSVTLTVSAPTTTTSTVELLQNGSVVATANLLSGKTYGFVSVNPKVKFGSRLDAMQVTWPTVDANITALGGGIEVE